MTNDRAGATRGGRGNLLGFRVRPGFISVALAAIALLAGLTVVFASADVSALDDRQRTELTSAVAAAAGAGWDLHDNWAEANLFPALDLASHTGAAGPIRGTSGVVGPRAPRVQSQLGTAVPGDRHGRSQARGRGRRPVHPGGLHRRRRRATVRAAAGDRGCGRARGAAGAGDRARHGAPPPPPGVAHRLSHPG